LRQCGNEALHGKTNILLILLPVLREPLTIVVSFQFLEKAQTLPGKTGKRRVEIISEMHRPIHWLPGEE
jgi:hypothetical protein